VIRQAEEEEEVRLGCCRSVAAGWRQPGDDRLAEWLLPVRGGGVWGMWGRGGGGGGEVDASAIRGYARAKEPCELPSLHDTKTSVSQQAQCP
jgi:hypothetical protein